MSFEGKVAIVTGGASGIGRGVCSRLRREGASVVAADLATSQDEGIVSKQTDVADEGQVDSLVTSTLDQFGRLDVLVNCAGNAGFAAVADLSFGDWQSVIDVHLTGMFLCCRAAIEPLLKTKGRIVSVSSNYGFKGRKGGSNYSAAKAGIVALTKVLAHELAPDVTVNAVAPGPTDTPRWRHGHEGAELEQRIAERSRDVPLGRIGQPADIAGAVAFLLGPDAAWITGSVVHVNGGEFML